MRFEWDEAKAGENFAKHGVSFELALQFEFNTALEAIDDRRDYGESRMVAIGFIAERLYVLIYTKRDDALRVISLRKANRREAERYERESRA